MIPNSTYRLQFHKDFGFDDAARIVPYLAHLGISHVYASPFLKARPGSTHGYDIVDHDALNPELGGDEGFARFTADLRAHGLGLILDFVPNHMGVGGADNPAWLDVLEWGNESEFAVWFDIDWDPNYRYLKGKLLVPFLGTQYGGALANGDLELKFDAEAGEFAVWAYGSHKLPICPLDYAGLLGRDHLELERLGDAFSDLPTWPAHVPARARELKGKLAALATERADVRDAIGMNLAALTGTKDNLDSWRDFDELVQRQNWRLAHFRVAGDDINYRRFFNINDLAGLRMEARELFDHAHRLVFRMLADGTLSGLRIDHIDGLLDPLTYLKRLREEAGDEFYLVVEKILAHHEQLREDWPVQGTTGYEFTNLLLGLLVDPAGEDIFTATYQNFTGEHRPFAEIVRLCKIRIAENEMASELNVLARDAARIARQNPMTADFTRNILGRAMKEIVACFPVYRTYIDGSAPTDADKRDLDWAFQLAQRNESELDPSVFTFLRRLLDGNLVAGAHSGFRRQSVLRFAMKLQQYTGPVMAKGLEDTAFYRYNRFVALNEVGGHPDQFGAPMAAFHRANAQRAKLWPQAMLGTSTHDTKRGEDTRARLAALSELGEEWARLVPIWSRILRARRGDVEGTAPPDRNDEYLFYQLLIGTWPAELTGSGKPNADALREYAERVKGAMEKSMREGKLNSNWSAPNMPYEDAVKAFVDSALDPDRSDAFLDAFLPFQEHVARLGLQNSLAQTVLKLTLPGMPDIYQGAEGWDLSLMDPDNRRPVDFMAREKMLQAIGTDLVQDPDGTMTGLMQNWHDGGAKLAVTATLLKLRQAHPALFSAGSYNAVEIQGERADQICAFLRRDEGATLLVAVRRFPHRAETETDWGATAVMLPEDAAGRDWIDVLTWRAIRPDGITPAALFAIMPVAVLRAG